MRVLYILQDAGFGSVQQHVLNLLRGLREVQEASVAVGEAGFFTEAAGLLGVPYHVLPNLIEPISPAKDLLATMDVARLIRRTRIDLVHAHTLKAGIIGRLAARVAGVPSVYTAHSWCFAEGGWGWRLVGIPIERVAGRLGSMVINVSDANHKWALRQHIAPDERMIAIWNGIPDSRKRARPEASRIPQVISVAPCTDQNDHGLLLRVLARTLLPARMIFIGDSPHLSRLKEAAGRLHLEDRVDFLGHRHDVDQLLSQAHVFALPMERATYREEFPVNIVEAMRAGLPVIASNLGAVPEAVLDGETGFLIEPGDEETFSSRLRILLEEPPLRCRMGASGRERYQNKFALQPMLDRTWAVYLQAIFGGRANIVAEQQAHEDQEIVLHDS
jgi:glycosyltransferase involved in cell wall biosynthesis